MLKGSDQKEIKTLKKRIMKSRDYFPKENIKKINSFKEEVEYFTNEIEDQNYDTQEKKSNLIVCN